MLDKMIEQAKLARSRAYAPYSNFHVGACIRTPNNKLFIGANVENVAFHSSQCAESSAIGAMITSGEKQIEEIVTMGSGEVFCAPCGNCRQKMQEFSHPRTLVHICSSDKLLKTITLSELLPFSFSDIEAISKSTVKFS
jgi:cytidine deaminase